MPGELDFMTGSARRSQWAGRGRAPPVASSQAFFLRARQRRPKAPADSTGLLSSTLSILRTPNGQAIAGHPLPAKLSRSLNAGCAKQNHGLRHCAALFARLDTALRDPKFGWEIRWMSRSKPLPPRMNRPRHAARKIEASSSRPIVRCRTNALYDGSEARIAAQVGQVVVSFQPAQRTAPVSNRAVE
jgi:hypothetical protein